MTSLTAQGGFASPAAPHGPRAQSPQHPLPPRGLGMTLGLGGQPGEPPVLAAIHAGTSGLDPCAGWGSWDAQVPG